MMKINQNRISFVIALLFVTQFVLINVSYALSNGLVGDKEGKQYMIEQLKVVIELDKKIYKPEEPIIIKGKIENSTKETINLAPILIMSLLIYLKYEDGGVIPSAPQILLYERIRKEDIIKLQSGESHFFERPISKELHYIMPNKSGQYNLYVIYINKMENLGGIKLWTGELKSNVVTFEIK